MTNKLAGWLSETYAAKDYIGLDVASVRPTKGVESPAVYRVTNGEPDRAASRWFRVRELRPPGPYDADADRLILSAGDVEAPFWVQEFHEATRRAISSTGREPLPDDIVGLSHWLPWMVRAVSDAYRTFEIGQSISGRVGAATLSTFTGDAVLNRPT